MGVGVGTGECGWGSVCGVGCVLCVGFVCGVGTCT